ncbi:hypothetical protein [Rhodoluna sp.]|uniref:hypothetical protein n=1 Tax=Rhodoluna sp. TaxID=1969481 RepID=UPI0025D1F5DC|nr:hypothetical protein [Rhodoluna sp.]
MAAAPKIGSVCSKVGLVKTVATKTYSCVLKNRKKVWTYAKSKASAPTQTPTASVATVIDLDNLNKTNVRKAAWNEFTKTLFASQKSDASIELIVGASADVAYAKQQVPALQNSINLWSDIFKPKKVYATYFAEGDVNSVDSVLCAKANFCSGFSESFSKKIQQGIDIGACTGARAFLTDDNHPIIFQCIGQHHEDIQNLQTTPHEYFGNVLQASNPNVLPMWFSYGGGSFFGAYLGLYKDSSMPNQLDYFINFDARSLYLRQDICKTATEADIMNCFAQTDSMTRTVPTEKMKNLGSVSYYLGAVATEVLVAKFGIKQIKMFMMDVKTKSFATAFEDNFGLTPTNFYEKVAKYAVSLKPSLNLPDKL